MSSPRESHLPESTLVRRPDHLGLASLGAGPVLGARLSRLAVDLGFAYLDRGFARLGFAHLVLGPLTLDLSSGQERCVRCALQNYQSTSSERDIVVQTQIPCDLGSA